MLMALRVTDRLRVSRVAHAISAGYFSLAGGRSELWLAIHSVIRTHVGVLLTLRLGALCMLSVTEQL